MKKKMKKSPKKMAPGEMFAKFQAKKKPRVAAKVMKTVMPVGKVAKKAVKVMM